jgi:hypothetical protein
MRDWCGARGLAAFVVAVLTLGGGCGEPGVEPDASTTTAAATTLPLTTAEETWAPTTEPTASSTRATLPSLPARVAVDIDADALVHLDAGLGAVWVMGAKHGIPYLYRVDPATGVVDASWALGSEPADWGMLRVAVGDEFVWVVLRATVVRVDPEAGSMESIVFGRNDGQGNWLEYPWDVVVGEGAAWVVTVSQEAGPVSHLYRVDPGFTDPDRAVTGHVELGSGFIGDVLPMDGRVWVVPEGSGGRCRLIALNPSALTVDLQTTVTGDCATPYAALAAGGGYLAVTDGSSQLVRWVDPGTGDEEHWMDLESNGLVAHAADTMWVGAHSDDVGAAVWGIGDGDLKIWSLTPLDRDPADMAVTDEAVWVIMEEPSVLLRVVPEPSPPDLVPPTPGCSAEDLNVDLPNAPGMPGPVDDMRRAMAAAAVACDIDRLADLGRPGDFWWSVDPNAANDPADHWRFLEYEFGAAPLAGLVDLLGLSPGVLEDQGVLIYVWPSAAAYDDWASVPVVDREVLAALYSPEDLEAFAAENAYLGSSLGIDENGDWRWLLIPGN